MGYKIVVTGDQRAWAEFDSIPSAKEREDIKTILADTFVTVQVMKQLKLITGYIGEQIKSEVPTPKEETPKKVLPICPACGRKSLLTKKVVSEKQATFLKHRLNKDLKVGDTYLECINKECKKVQ